ncbi:hypothetical protein Zmor_011361 [Zophobas morio]|uniref:Uncharacterized protein n=1 Tax=Zophobas morio TaxID=2755281 RepID=A0AA38IR07_9CUCU|nr:hypothetical protein Zmor_011361 [Zophobas morio]
MGQKEEIGFSQLVCSASYIKRTRSHPYHVDKVHVLEPADCPRCVTHFLSDGTPHSRQQVRFQETVFDKCVSVEWNNSFVEIKCPEIIEELQQVKVAAATPVFFYLSTNLLRRSDACIASQGQHFRHFL